jgi:hypothetical protein
MLYCHGVYIWSYIFNTYIVYDVGMQNTSEVSPFVITRILLCFFIQQIETDVQTEDVAKLPS